MTTTAVIITSDLHINSSVALCTPTVTLDDGGTYSSSRIQRWLWDSWLEFWDWATSYGTDTRYIAVFNGDVIDVDVGKRSRQTITRNKATALRMAVDVLEPALAKVTAAYIVRGTEAHTGKSGEMEESIAQDLTNSVHCSPDIASWWQLQATCEGVRLDISHHASMGGRPWSEKNAGNNLAADCLMRYAIGGQAAPHLVIRGHQHRWADSFDNYPVRAVYLPAWQTATAYIHKIGQGNKVSDIGGAVVICSEGQYLVEKRTFKPKEARKTLEKVTKP